MTRTWEDLAVSNPELAAAGERLLRPSGDGVAFLATVRADGGPRLHPVMPVLTDGRLHVFVVRLSPKHDDLVRDGRYALHAMPPDGGGEEFYLTGRAFAVDGKGRRAAVTAASGGRLGSSAPVDANPELLRALEQRLGGGQLETLFELAITHVLYTQWAGWGTAKAWPEYHRWPGR